MAGFGLRKMGHKEATVQRRFGDDVVVVSFFCVGGEEDGMIAALIAALIVFALDY